MTVSIDMTAAAQTLKREPRAKAFCGLVRRATEINSIIVDLEDARDSIAELRAMSEAQSSGKHSSLAGLISHALTLQAIMLYVRSTKTEGARPPLQVLHAYDAEDRKQHRSLANLRDNALAHYGYGGDKAQPWADERLLFQIQPEPARFQFAFDRTNYAQWVMDALDRLVPKALAVARQILDAKHQGIADEQMRLADIISALDQSKLVFDPDTFFRSSSARRNYMAGNVFSESGKEFVPNGKARGYPLAEGDTA